MSAIPRVSYDGNVRIAHAHVAAGADHDAQITAFRRGQDRSRHVEIELGDGGGRVSVGDHSAQGAESNRGCGAWRWRHGHVYRSRAEGPGLDLLGGGSRGRWIGHTDSPARLRAQNQL